MLREFITWWAEQMRALLPRLSARAAYRDAVVVRADGTGLALSARRRGGETLLGPLTPGDALRRLQARPPGPIILALPAAALLQQPATLPLAAERDLAAVLRHEMDRLTPFRADDLFWTWRVDRRDRVAGRLLLRLLLVPKPGLQATLAALDAAGLRPVAIEVPANGGTEHLSLAAPDAAGGSRRGAVTATWLCAALALTACIVPVVRQERAVAAVEDRVEALRPRVALVDGLRRRLAANTSGSDLFAAETARIGNPLHALAAVTAALPDDSYLTSFALRERKLSLGGRSAAAARLIAALSANPELRDPAFDAPVTRVGDRADLFSIRAELAPMPTPK